MANGMRLAQHLLYEEGVLYTFDKKTANEMGMRRLSYKWVNIPTGKKGTKHLYTGGIMDLLLLLNYWNRDPIWKYYTTAR
jgi:hypothetical protein